MIRGVRQVTGTWGSAGGGSEGHLGLQHTPQSSDSTETDANTDIQTGLQRGAQPGPWPRPQRAPSRFWQSGGSNHSPAPPLPAVPPGQVILPSEASFSSFIKWRL